VVIHRHLRGRYLLATGLALALALPAGLLGYIAIKPRYTSTGIVRVAPTLPKSLYDIEENQQLRSFDSFVAAQASTLESARVAEMAVEDRALRAAGWTPGPAGVTELSKSLEVSLKRGAEIINVSVSHPNPTLSKEAVNAVLRAYDKIQREKFGSRLSDKEQDLVQRQSEAERDLQSIRDEIGKVQQVPGTEDRDGIYAMKVESQLQLESEVARIDAQIARLSSADPPGPPDPARNAFDGDRERESLAAADHILAGLIAEDVALQTEIIAKEPTYLPLHPVMRDLLERRHAIGEEIKARVLALKEAGVVPLDPAHSPQTPSISELKKRRELLVPLLTSVRDEVSQIVASRNAFMALTERATRTDERYNDISHALEVLTVENKHIAEGRVQIIQWGNLPSAPSSDRRMPVAAAGALGGAGLGVGLIILLGLLKGGLRYIDDIDQTRDAAPLIGAIPDLGFNDPAERELAALSVHHLRNMLHSRAGDSPSGKGGATVYTITSSSSGDGKTSLTLALGMSFAVAGFRTLLIDADLVGRGLSRQLNADRSPGLSDAVMAGHLNGEVRPGLLAGISLLPAGATDGFEPEMLSARTLSDLLEACRSKFDIVLIDTGPVLGSLEANLTAPLSDGVVLVVSRGQNGKLVRSTLDRLDQLNSPCLGLVFNKVKRADFHQSATGKCLSTRSGGGTIFSRSHAGPVASTLASAVAGSRTAPSPDRAP
jgi:capsular exopolysaccharide synthesis family protein